MPDPKRVVSIAELLTEKPLVGIGLNKENMNKDEIKEFKMKFKNIFNVPVTEPLGEGVGDIVDFLEELDAD
jgi:uncharacterized NAD-dependent epimerase/dehydratase family protein